MEKNAEAASAQMRKNEDNHYRMRNRLIDCERERRQLQGALITINTLVEQSRLFITAENFRPRESGWGEPETMNAKLGDL